MAPAVAASDAGGALVTADPEVRADPAVMPETGRVARPAWSPRALGMGALGGPCDACGACCWGPWSAVYGPAPAQGEPEVGG
ncbi:hypothetical protein GCM10020000_06410 [Streptomyces olivoverticillatus]